MTVFSAIFELLIGPLEFFFDILYSLAFRVLANQGLAIVVLSLCMNFLVLPLYRKADAMQAEERELEQRLQPWVKHIKKTFTGDERFMMLQAFYRENGYKPSYALKGSLSLLLEIPFFIAAYRFLSGLALLEGVAFGPIRDLGAPDGLLRLGGVSVNVLPILMTGINIVSGAVYTRGMSLKSKIQLYGMALIFLVLLYQSPAGLVFYWTLNNLFSLAKNVICKLKRPGLALSCLCSAVSAALLAVVLFVRPMNTASHQLYAIVALLLLQLPLPAYLLLGRRLPEKGSAAPGGEDKGSFLLACLALALLTGVLIPSAVIKSSPAEFVNIYAFRSPLLYVAHSALLAAGAFLIWPGVFFALSAPRDKPVLTAAAWLACGCAVINYMFFGTGLGTLSPTLLFQEEMRFSHRELLLNLLVLLLAAAALTLIWKKRKSLARFLLAAVCIAAVFMSASNLLGIRTQTQTLRQAALEQGGAGQQGQTEKREEPSLVLSKTGKNVIVIMLDRAISGYFPFEIQEKPELKEQFDGFVYYPNTISFGGYTNMAAPSLYGGYEYTPVEMNRRDDELLADKNDEALKVMPVLFDGDGYRVTVCDPTYAGYGWLPDLSIYDDYPGIRTFITLGRYGEDPSAVTERTARRLNRDFFCYGLLKTLPLFAQPYLYDEGSYSESNAMLWRNYQTRDGFSKALGIDTRFMAAYSVLEALPSISVVDEGTENAFLMLSNDTAHEPTLLQEPEFAPADIVDNEEYDAMYPQRLNEEGEVLPLTTDRQLIHYHCNMASLVSLGRWFDWLRANGVYDNTRIIIVADHGRLLDQQLPELLFFDGELDAMLYNPLLLVKDFGSTGAPVTDRSFMTNADVPTLAMRGLIENPVNPFTGKPINSDPKHAPELFILSSDEWDISGNCGTTFLPAPWLSVHDDIFTEANWSLNAVPPTE